MGKFFGAIQELRDKIAATNQYVILNTIIKRPGIQKFITNRITEIQLSEQNVDSLGVKLSANRSGYADLTLVLAAQGLEGYTRPKKGRDNVDLYATGDYHKSHEVNVVSLTATFFEVLADAQKEDVNLIEEWGPVLGLTPETMEILGEILRVEYLKIFLKEL